MRHKYVPVFERAIGLVSGLFGVVQAVAGNNKSVGIGLCVLGVVLLFLGFRERLSLESCLRNEVESLVKNKLYHVAIRWAECSSRSLWLDGSYRARVEIGQLAVAAATAIGPEAIRHKIRALVDDCGWTSVEMGDLKPAEDLLREGIDLADKNGWPHMKAKGLRHLAGKYLRAREFTAAAATLVDAFNATTATPAGTDRDELLAEWHYAQGVLQLERANLVAADESITQAEVAYRNLPGKEWRAKIQVRRGEIEFKRGETAKALGIFSEAKEVAGEYRYKRVLVKAQLGLAMTYLKLNRLSDAKAELRAIKKALKGSEMQQEKRELAAIYTDLQSLQSPKG
jgi:tetratricopeptide (TPR) repeat protein